MGRVILISPEGHPEEFSTEEAPRYIDEGYRVEGASEHAQRVGKEQRLGDISAVESFGQGVGRGMSAGGTDAIQRLGGGQAAAQYLREAQEAHPTLSTAGEVVGVVAPALLSGGTSALARTPAGMIGRLGAGIAEAGEGASLLTRVGRSAAGGVAEGGLFGLGTGVSELALSDKPIDAERVVSTLSSHMLYGAGVGGAAGSIGKVAEIGLAKAKGAIDEAVSAYTARANVADDLAMMDVKQLRVAAEAERDAIKAAHKTELETLETARVTERKAIADDIAALRRDVKDSNQWATTKDLKMPAAGEGRMSAAELGRVAAKAEKQLANALDNPIGLAKNPTKALDALQRQEHGLVKLIEHADDLRAVYAADGLAGKRIAALEAAPAILEKNRALQARIAKVNEALPELPKVSPRLEAIEAAKEALQMNAGGAGAIAGMPQRMLEGSAFSAMHGVVSSLPIPGAAFLATPAAAMVSKVVGDKVFGRLSKGVAEQVARTGKAVSGFLDTGARVTKAATPVATRVLSSVRFAPPRDEREQPAPAHGSELARHFAAREHEVRSQVIAGPDGKAQMRPEARQALGERLAPIAVTNPILADQLETLIARRIAFLADKLPRRPDILGVQVGPDKWQPGDMAMRKWARYVAAVEDPGGIEERLAAGAVSPEDAEVMREVYPERLREITQQIVAQLPQLRGQLPYERKLALSIMTGVPVVAAMDPRIMGVLQGNYAEQAPAEDGPPGPVATPQFGSVSSDSAPDPTPAQRRAG